MTGPSSDRFPDEPRSGSEQQQPDPLVPWAATPDDARFWRNVITEVLDVETTPPSWARVLNALRCGNDCLPVDIAFVDRTGAVDELADIAYACLGFRNRVAWQLVVGCGIRQLLVIGTDLRVSWTANVHSHVNLSHLEQPSQPVRVLYVDDDPFVLGKARAWSVEGNPDPHHVRRAAVEDPQQIMRAAADTFDLSQPVGVLFLYLERYDNATAAHLTGELARQLAPGSYLALAGITAKEHGPALRTIAPKLAPLPMVVRDPADFLDLYGSWQPVTPVAPRHVCQPEPAATDPFTQLMLTTLDDPLVEVWGGVATLPDSWPSPWHNDDRVTTMAPAARPSAALVDGWAGVGVKPDQAEPR
ncbi:SAM-dependent methyltransferase [Spirillospora sp. NPDC048911]|uniref:SAM-dependent methyltransferase n=1 Tax=Spirillospora sp. NPDC048911 TaxID=3364527 RepID=UPI003711697A